MVTDDDTNGLYTATGTWTKASATGQQGTSHRTHAAAAGSTDKFTWTLDVPADGSYTLSAAWPQVSGAATDAKFTLNHGDGAGTDVNFTANQTTGAAAWNTLGKVTLSKGEKVTVALAPSGTGTVVADAVRLVRDNAADTDVEDKAFAYAYDLNGNLTDITDTSRGTAKNADAYAMAYDGLNQIKSVREDLAGSPAATTSYTYNNLGAPLTVAHPDQSSEYVYNDPRNLLTKVTVDDLNDTKAGKVTSYTYDALGRQKTITKGNGNVTTNAFQSDGALKSMREETSAGALVASHTYTYDANGNQLEDVASKRNADNASATLDSTTTYVYDPVDRLSRKTKTGHGASTENYVHDANANVIQQTVGGTSTSFNYDRNRLLSSTVDGQTASYRYDSFGRQTSVVGGGKTISRTTYDGFDHIKVAEQANDAGVLEATRYTYDPLDRTASKTTSGSGGKTTDYTYLGLSQEVLGDEVAGELTKSYQYSPWGQRLSQVSYKADAEAGIEAGETGYYGHNAHSDVETMTDDAGKTVATYGYTAYGENDDAEFTGIDKPDAANPEQPSDESFNAYRFNGKRWDAGSATYDMGFRDYAPGLNTFTTRDMYNGALADMGLGADPFTGSRYAFASGNPISGIELDGHVAIDGDGNPIFPSEQNSNPGASRPRAHAPAVDNSDLDNLLKKIYGREFVADEDLFGDGKVSTAIIDEYNTGKPRGSWHVEKGSALLTGIAKLLAKDRNARQKTGNGILSDADLKIAKAEAGELWNALNSNDVTGNVTAHVRSSPETLKAITSNREFVLKSEPLSSVTGQKFASGPHPKAPVRPVGEPANLRGGYKAFGIAAPLLTVASTPGYVRDYGLWGGMQEMFLDSIDPFGWRYDNPTVPKPIPPA
ncbi:RHS repeat-associated core domain-containing protein [Nocardioides sp. NPDC057767]|uniref:golvesin C-terminal-like domain-containing protein n=1 Tax=unclassified Nocardioides TaxID=2615069 RepID=UPI00366DB443